MKRTKKSMAVEEPIFYEIGGRTYEEFNEYRRHVRERRKDTYALRVPRFRTHIGQHLLFALYDLLGSKPAVEEWLFRNFRKGRSAYYQKHSSKQRVEKWITDYLLETNFPDPAYRPIFPCTSFVSYGAAQPNAPT
jgi:hypothetical protein